MTVGRKLYAKILSLERYESRVLLTFKSPVNFAAPVVVHPMISSWVSNCSRA